MGAWVALLLLVVAALVLLLRADAGTIAGFDPSDFAILVAGVALLIFIASSLAGSYRGRAGQAVRDVLTWALVAVVLVAGYSFREELLGLGHRVAGELLPPGTALRGEPQVVGERSVRIRKRSDGHFMVKTEANGIALSMLVDTGASTVVLKPADAQRLGIDVERLRYAVPVQTANGTTYAASVRLRNLAVGNIVLDDVDALVARPGALKDNLLGMSFLSRLRSYEFTSEYLTLRS
ncbi:MAG: TIGR02281 family clan AA aspartic protease [Hyphomonadaceae bacterium]|jgi:aspartyl protease family protein|nr:TIGR02281 family clan AA aspartic protease [Hyphomonadaceae bacterium]